MPTIYTEVEVDVDLSEFSDDDLLEEIEIRGLGAEAADTEATELIQTIFAKRRLNQDYQRELDELIYNTIGRIV